MSGPMGGGQGRKRMIGKGVRRMATRGFKLGSYVSIAYRDPDRAHSMVPNIIYEGKISDKRVGHQDRESYVELKDCLVINEQGQVVAKGDKKRLMDAFIEECEAAEPREDRTPIHLRPSEPEPVAQFSPMSMGQMSMGGMQAQGMSMVPMMQMMGGGQQGMQAMPMMQMMGGQQGMQGMPMMQMMPMMQGMPAGSCDAQGGQMQMMMMPMMGGGQQMQGGQQMMMMPMMQGGMAVPAVSSSSRARSRSRSR